MKNISIITHKNTDIDAFASVISLAETIIHFTNDKNYNVFPILENFKTSLDIKTKIKLYTLDDVKDKKMDYVIVCDVNEEDRVYGIEIFDTIPIENRFLIDHHDKNRNELHVLPKNKLLNPHACSTSEIIADVLIKKNINVPSNVSYYLYLGMASDTACFQRSYTSKSIDIAHSLINDEKVRHEIEEKMYEMSYEQKKLYDSIKVDNQLQEYNILLFHLNIKKEVKDITSLLKHPLFDKLTKPTNEYPLSIFIIEIENNYFIKFKKNDNCDIDILNLAIAFNGGGHANRCAGRIYNSSYDEVIKKIKDLYLNNNLKLCKFERKGN